MADPELWADGLEVPLENLAVVHQTQQSRAFIVIAVIVVARSGEQNVKNMLNPPPRGYKEAFFGLA